MQTVRLGRTGEFIKISVAKTPARQRPDVASGNLSGFDANWVDALIEAEVCGFRARYFASLERGDFPRLYESLSKLYSFDANEAEFSTIEDQLHIVIKGDKRGNFEATCVAKEGTYQNILQFSLKFDQTDLPPALSALKEVCENYPVLGVLH